MLQFKTMFTRERKYIVYLLAIYVLGWGFTSYQPIFLGLILGTTLSLFNLWLLVRKIDQFGEVMEKGGKMRSLGLMSRMAAAIFAVLLAVEYPEYIHLISVVIGLMTSYLVIMIDSFIQLFQSQKK
ncbi:ATP synthase subunit I [Niallia endozanthoxylica]|uniref:ATP synthase subunit I n=1 Tax=Niallia endozanthoxylica TaxID=2036016 RepID=A0A5J5HXY0_9BACI|nr:ATP synthase subunit I [Niallia endozanthoxylica]KAA9027847.1 ATP synthase subunit I [Niallia endozanthoxylica]